MKPFCLFLVLSAFGMVPAYGNITLSSDHAIYNDNVAELHGHVVLEHPIGILKAEHALIPSKSLVEIWDGVTMDLTERNSVLSCGYAVVDRQNGIATCHCDSSPVTYTESENLPFTIQGPLLTVTFDSESGLVRNLHMSEPVGTAKGDDPVTFSAQTLDWDQQDRMLQLNDQVEIEVEGRGSLAAPGPVKLSLGDRTIDTIVCEGAAELEFTDEDTLLDHTLTCPGGARINQRTGIAILYSKEGQQVLFEDQFGEIFADQVRIEYKSAQRAVVPTRFILEGHVRILNRYVREGEEPGGHMQYALADRVVYTPASKLMDFTSKRPQRVLFYDRTKSLQVSAPKLTIKRDEPTRKEIIQGGGDVRFSFNKLEMQQLLQRFGLPPEPEDE